MEVGLGDFCEEFWGEVQEEMGLGELGWVEVFLGVDED